jgi:hypothetical protein
VRDGGLNHHEEDAPMAMKKRTTTRKARKPPEKEVGALKAGKVNISKTKLSQFMKELEKKGITAPKVRFVARNAPFMRRLPVTPV